jgi:SPP1 family predicted phage head-tail adaptor
MNAGELDTRITIQRRQSGRDSVGQPVETWTDVCTCWASVKTPIGMEAIRAGASVATTLVSIRIRYRTGLDAGMRVVRVRDDQIYNITRPPLSDRRADRVDILAEAVNARS